MSLHTLLKLAETSDGQDAAFEKSFSNIAHAYVANKAPGLVAHEIGFQVLERRGDNFGVGVTAFKLGPLMVQAPVVYDRGKLYGEELLFVVNQNMFVPMRDGWVDYLRNRRPSNVGESVEKHEFRGSSRAPDLMTLLTNPYKSASAKSRRVEGLIAAIRKDPDTTFSAGARVLQKHANWSGESRFETMLAGVSPRGFQRLLKTAQVRPLLRSYLIERLGEDKLTQLTQLKAKQAADRAAADAETQLFRAKTRWLYDQPQKKADLKIVISRYTLQSLPDDEFTDEDREKLLNDKILIADDRVDADVTSLVQPSMPTTTPHHTGVYDMLNSAGKWVRATIVTGLGGASEASNKPYAAVFCEGCSAGAVVPRAEIVVRPEMRDRSEWHDWLSSSGNNTPSSNGSRNLQQGVFDNTTYIAVSPAGLRTVGPLHVTDTLDADSYSISRAEIGYRAKSLAGVAPATVRDLNGEDSLRVDGPEGSQARSEGRTLIVPEDYRWLQVDTSLPSPCGDKEVLDKSASASLELKITGLSAGRYELQGKTRPDRVDTLARLVGTYGLREKTARDLLRRADENPGKRQSVMCKLADRLQTNPSGLIEFPEDRIVDGYHGVPFPTMLAGEQTRAQYPNGPIAPPESDYEPFNWRKVGPAIEQAMQGQRRDAIDTSILSAIVASDNEDSLIDEHIPHLVAGMDAAGRLLLALYVHRHKFAERYGKTETFALEDQLQSQFQQAGELILKLRESSVNPLPEDLYE